MSPTSHPYFVSPPSIVLWGLWLHSTNSPSDGPKKHLGSIRLCDSFPSRVIGSELAGNSSFPRCSLPKAHIPVKTAMGWALAGRFLVPCSLFLLCLSVKGVGALGQGGMSSLTKKQDPACSKYQLQTQQSSPVYKSQGVCP